MMMMMILTLAGLLLGARTASVPRWPQCSCTFQLSTSGTVSFPVGEDSEGEILGGSRLSPASFCLNGDSLFDSAGNPCWFTPPTFVLQCDQGAAPANNVSVSCSGELSVHDQTTFYECANGINDEVNIYLKPDEGVNCGRVTLNADGCRAKCHTSSSSLNLASQTASTTSHQACSLTETTTVTTTVAKATTATETATVTAENTLTTTSTVSSVVTMTQTASVTNIQTVTNSVTVTRITTVVSISTLNVPSCPQTSTSVGPPISSPARSSTTPQTSRAPSTTSTTSSPPQSTCPLDLPRTFEFPHLIVQIDSTTSSSASGTSYFGKVSQSVSTIFNFDIPSSYTGKQCSLWFLLPTQAELQTSSFTLSGAGTINFAHLSTVASQDTTYNNAPAVDSNLGHASLVPGNAYQIAQFACPAGTATSIEMSAEGDTQLNYFQDSNPCPIGLYIIPSE